MGVNVFIWNKYVGALVRTEQGIAFQYDAQFKKSNLELSPFNLSCTGKEVYINEVDWIATGGIPGVIYDSLPDRFGNNTLRIISSQCLTLARHPRAERRAGGYLKNCITHAGIVKLVVRKVITRIGHAAPEGIGVEPEVWRCDS